MDETAFRLWRALVGRTRAGIIGRGFLVVVIIARH
jgi:hypothetical protein